MTGYTYGQLDATMRSFGFVVRDLDADTRVYVYPGSEAMIAIPIFPDTQEAYPHHLTGARMVLDLYGIAKPDEFISRLQKAA
jgi:hypothetical protein